MSMYRHGRREPARIYNNIVIVGEVKTIWYLLPSHHCNFQYFQLLYFAAKYIKQLVKTEMLMTNSVV